MRVFVLTIGLVLAGAAWAQDDPAAEHRRLQGELRSLAQKSAWSGVDRTYRVMVDLGVPLHINDHLQGAQAATARGDALLALLRLQRVVHMRPGTDAPDEEHTAYEEARMALEHLAKNYGPVSISVGEGRNPVLDRPVAPFAPDERIAVENAVERLSDERAFRGLLPVGSYTVDGVPFDVRAGKEWQPVVIAAVR